MLEKPIEDLAAAVGLVNATHQMLTGQMTGPEYAALVESVTGEQWPQQPVDAVRAVAYLTVRVAGLFAAATGSDVDTVLGFLGSEVATLRS